MSKNKSSCKRRPLTININDIKVGKSLILNIEAARDLVVGDEQEVSIEIVGNRFPIQSPKYSIVGPPRPLKKPLVTEELVNQLKSHGITMDDSEEEWAFEVLKEVNYYKLSIFVKFLTEPKLGVSIDGDFSFNRLMEIYNFDEFLRNEVSKLITPVEEYLRTAIANFLSCSLARDGCDNQISAQPYLCRDIFKDSKDISQYLDRMEHFFYTTVYGNIDRELSLQHYVKNYGGYIPIWVLVEHLTLGNISELVNNLSRDVRLELITDKFSIIRNGEVQKITGPKQFPKLITTIKMVRNICAHNGRLYAKSINFTPDFKGLNLGEINVNDEYFKKRFFGWLLSIRCFYGQMSYKRKTEWNIFIESLSNQIESFSINTKPMGLDTFNAEDWVFPN